MSAWGGIDVGKSWLDVGVLGKPGTRRFANDVAGVRELVQWLAPLQPERVVLEATGGYERAALEALHAVGVPVIRVNPRQARDFAKALGQLAKTDAQDAHVLARMAATMEGPLYSPREAWRVRLGQWQQRRGQVVQLLQIERQRQARLTDTELRRYAQRHLAFLEKELRALDAAIAAQLRERREGVPLCSLRGVGPVLQATLACELPELGRLDGKAIAKLVGVAPLARTAARNAGDGLSGVAVRAFARRCTCRP